MFGARHSGRIGRWRVRIRCLPRSSCTARRLDGTGSGPALIADGVGEIGKAGASAIRTQMQ